MKCVLKKYGGKYEEENNYQPTPTKPIPCDASKEYKGRTTKVYKLIYDMDIPVIIVFHHTCLVLPYFCLIQKHEPADVLMALLEKAAPREIFVLDGEVRQNTTSSGHVIKLGVTAVTLARIKKS